MMNDPNNTPSQLVQRPYMPPPLDASSQKVKARDRAIDVLVAALKPLAEFELPQGSISIQLEDAKVTLNTEDIIRAREALHLVSLYQQ